MQTLKILPSYNLLKLKALKDKMKRENCSKYQPNEPGLHKPQLQVE